MSTKARKYDVYLIDHRDGEASLIERHVEAEIVGRLLNECETPYLLIAWPTGTPIPENLGETMNADKPKRSRRRKAVRS